MIAFKGFNNNLQCTMGKGTYQYEIGKTYKEDKAKCVASGFHCVEEPIEVLKWYPSGRWCMVEASGDIHEDGDERIACTEMKIIKELTKQELGMQECVWLHTHPDREYSRCELIKETEKELERLRRKQDRVHDVVKGSMEEFPYTQKNIHIEGIDRNSKSSKIQRKEELLLIERKRKAQMIKEQVEEMINQMPARIQRIVKMRYFENYSWEEIAVRMGRNASADSVRMECRRYLE